MATPQDLINQINASIVTNGNNEITAIVLNPILIDMVTQYAELIGTPLSNLLTNDQTSLVNAINEVVSTASGITNVIAGSGITINYLDPNNPIISVDTLFGSQIVNNSSVVGTNVSDALDYLQANGLGIATLDDIGNVNIVSPLAGDGIIWTGLDWINVALVRSFLGLNDTPIEYTGNKGKRLVVNNAEDGLVFRASYFDWALSNENKNLKDEVVFQLTCNRKYVDVSEFVFSVTTPPTGSDIIIDILKNGVSVFSVLPRIDAGELSTTTSATQSVLISGFDYDIGDLFTAEIVQTGSGDEGKGLKGTMKYNDVI